MTLLPTPEADSSCRLVLAGAAGAVWEDSIPPESKVLGLWFAYLPKAHVVMEWYVIAIDCIDREFTLSLAPLDPETYIETGYNPYKHPPIEIVQQEDMSFPVEGLPLEKALHLVRWLLQGMVEGHLKPTRWEYSTWGKAVTYGINHLCK